MPRRWPRRSSDNVHARNQIIKDTHLDWRQVYETLLAQGERLKPWTADVLADAAPAMAAGQRVLFEGAQGTMLDIDHGTYPFVTSSNASIGGVCTGLGVPPQAIGGVLGVAKAYTTRVGEGPLPTELHGEMGDRLRESGNEYGASTGRPRRCGWYDAVAVRYAARLNGLQAIALTKLDVLDGLDQIEVAVAYRIGGRVVRGVPGGAAARRRPASRSTNPGRGGRRRPRARPVSRRCPRPPGATLRGWKR